MWPLGIVLAGLAAVFIPAGSIFLRHYAVPVSSAVGIYVCFLVLCFYVIALAMPAGRALFGSVLGTKYKHIVLVLLLAAPYIEYAVGTHDFRWSALLRVLAIPSAVIAVYTFLPVRNNHNFTWQDALVGAWLLVVVLFQGFKGIWNVPTNLDFMGRLFITSLGAFSWIYVRPVPSLGYNITFSRKVLKAAGLNFLRFAAIAIPLGLGMRFISWNPRWHGATQFALDGIEIFLFIALLEELFFRGFLQTLLTQSFRSWWVGQLVVSCLFGLFHILHAPFPNWRYVLLASIAGWFYGSAYRNGGTIFGSAVVHAAVDTLWRTFFTSG
jgi:hypothetical protein